ncbi:MAG: lipocalin family protein [Ignavibacteriae bacterium]|nr:lipocalin family protein [Ignavibacteriota bacterium]
MARNIVGMILVLACLAGCGGNYAPLDTVQSVDLQRYTGLWNEIASKPVSQQEGCRCTTAEYSIREDGDIRVVNTCRKGGEISQAEGKAFIVPNTNNTKLRVQFFWPFRGDYWILDLADDYSYAVVGLPSRKYFWILSRTPRMHPDTLRMLTDRLAARGFDTATMQVTTHDCDGLKSN